MFNHVGLCSRSLNRRPTFEKACLCSSLAVSLGHVIHDDDAVDHVYDHANNLNINIGININNINYKRHNCWELCFEIEKDSIFSVYLSSAYLTAIQ